MIWYDMRWRDIVRCTHFSIGGVVDIHELVHCPVEPAHEEDAQRQAMREQHQRGVIPEAPGIDVPDHVILKDGHSVIHIGPAPTMSHA